MGGAFLNHVMFMQYLGKECVKKALDNADDTIELASEIKIAVVLFQNLPKTTSTIVIIASRLQGNNETSSFARDICEAARLFEDDLN